MNINFANMLKSDKLSHIVLKAVLSATVITVAAGTVGFGRECREIRENVLRMHIIANSDSKEDQAVKLMVRDKILECSEELFTECQDEEEALKAAAENTPVFENAAKQVLQENGIAYPVSVSVGSAYFDNRDYDGFTLPAGEYQAVRVILGAGEGKNWWCVMFPQVCLPAASKHDISENLTDTQTDIIKNKPKYEVRFKVVEWYEKLQNMVRKENK